MRTLSGAPLLAGLTVLLAIPWRLIHETLPDFLFYLGYHDLIGYGGALLVVLLACGLAAFFPARRAARVDPASTLRNE